MEAEQSAIYFCKDDAMHLRRQLALVISLLHGLAASYPATGLSSFGNGLAGVQVTETPMMVLNYSLPEGSTIGTTTHFWCTGGDGIDDSLLMEYFVDGELVPSISFTPARAAGQHKSGFTTPSSVDSLKETWSAGLFGKAAQQGGWFNGFQVPFRESLVVTARVVDQHQPSLTAWIKVAGENHPSAPCPRPPSRQPSELSATRD